ncbi:MAG: amidase [Actinomycetota bacterium]|nr:amidase [Actinomycetota bacterium]
MDLDLGLRSATDLLAMLRSGEVSSVELLDCLLARNERLSEPVNAIVTLDAERAYAAARAADEARAAGEPGGVLDGLPMTVKDALATEGIRSTGGATELADHVPDHDAEVVTRVKDAGAIVFGKTNLPRWSGDSQAWNDIFGTTNNPWDLTRGPGGSSGGASAALAAGLTPLEIGTDIGGSVRLPAHFAGVCGHKPSFGIVPQLGYVDHVTYGVGEADVNVVGPLARTVDDVELLFDLLIGPRADQAAAWSLELPKPRATSRDLRVAAWLDDPACPVSNDVSQALDAAVRAIEEDGLAVDRNARPAHPFEDVFDVGLPLISAATSPGRSQAEFDELRAAADDQDSHPTLAMRAKASTVLHRDWILLTERREANRQSWTEFFKDHDVLLAPVSFVPAYEHQYEGTLYTRRLDVDGVDRPYAHVIAWTSQFGYVYLPATVVPVGWTDGGLPVGIQVVGPYLGDRTCIEFARYLESLLGGYRVPPIAQL